MGEKITFMPDKITITVDAGEKLLAAAAAAGVYIHAFCGGEGVCGKCRVTIREGKTASERGPLTEADYKAGVRLACRTSVISDLVAEIPEELDNAGRTLKYKPKTTSPIAARPAIPGRQYAGHATPAAGRLKGRHPVTGTSL
jgi:uncharacterized 2Fe-2S/4Fe-4S cluster protein (DUF4445 family)